MRARRVRMSTEGQAVQKLLEHRRTKADILKEAEVPLLIHFSFYVCLLISLVSSFRDNFGENFQQGWCDSKGTLQDVKTKIQMRQEGAFKRERALAYSLAQKVLLLQEF